MPPELKDYCEMKRLYVSPQARGMGVSEALLKAILERARQLNYGGLKLDTLPSMEGAIRLYKRYVQIPAYYETPIESTAILGVDLSSQSKV